MHLAITSSMIALAGGLMSYGLDLAGLYACFSPMRFCKSDRVNPAFHRDVTTSLCVTVSRDDVTWALSGVPSTCPMLAVLTMASTWAAGAARLTGLEISPRYSTQQATPLSTKAARAADHPQDRPTE
jgi:hypothetical protein